MDFFAGTWVVWLIMAVVCFGYVTFNQIDRIKRIWESGFREMDKAFFTGLKLLFLVSLIGTVCSIFFIIGVIANFVID